MRAARTVFKNVGLQSAAFETDGACVAVVGDEGLDMPLRSPDGEAGFRVQHVPWLVATLNEKHERNWAKTLSLRGGGCARVLEELAADRAHGDDDDDDELKPRRARYDVVGDVAVLRRPVLPDEDAAALAARVLGSNGKLPRVVVAPPAGAQLAGAHRSPAAALVCLGGGTGGRWSPRTTSTASPVVVDLNACFFTPRLATGAVEGGARAVARDERVLCLFAGCGAEALIIAATTACSKVACVEVNPVATRCLGGRSRRCGGKGDAAADRVEVVCADVLDDLAARARRGETFRPRARAAAQGQAGRRPRRRRRRGRRRRRRRRRARRDPLPGGDLARSHADGRRPLDRFCCGPRAAGVRADADVSDRGVCRLVGAPCHVLHSAKGREFVRRSSTTRGDGGLSARGCRSARGVGASRRAALAGVAEAPLLRPGDEERLSRVCVSVGTRVRSPVRRGVGFFFARVRFFRPLGGLGTPRGGWGTCLRKNLAARAGHLGEAVLGKRRPQLGPTPRCADRSAPEAFDSHREGLGSPGEREILLLN